MKGNAASVLPFLVLFISSIALVFVALSLSNSLAFQSSQVVNDLRTASRASGLSGSYLHDYIGVGAGLSIDRESWSLAGRGGGDIDWSDGNLDDVRDEAIDNLETGASERLNDNFGNNLEGVDCSFDHQNFDIQVRETGNGLKATVSPEGGSLETTCAFSDGRVKVNREGRRAESTVYRDHNRYIKLVEEVEDVFDSIDDEYDDISNSFSSSTTLCGQEARALQSAEASALSSARSKAKEEIRHELNNANLPGWVEMSKSDFSVSVSMDSSGVSGVGSCNCRCQASSSCVRPYNCGGGACSPNQNRSKIGESYVCAAIAACTVPRSCGEGSCRGDEKQICDTNYRGSATASIDSATVTLHLKDDRKKVLTGTGYRSITFKVDDYDQSIS